MTCPTSPTHHLVLQARATNRPGLLEVLARFVSEHGGNVVKDVVEVLGEEAFLLLYVEAAPATAATMRTRLADLQRTSGLEVHLLPATPASPTGPVIGDLLAISEDFPGLLARVAAWLASHGMDIQSHRGYCQVTRDSATGAEKRVYVQHYTLLRPPTMDLLTFEVELQARKLEWNGVFLRYHEGPASERPLFLQMRRMSDFPAGT